MPFVWGLAFVLFLHELELDVANNTMRPSFIILVIWQTLTPTPLISSALTNLLNFFLLSLAMQMYACANSSRINLTPPSSHLYQAIDTKIKNKNKMKRRIGLLLMLIIIICPMSNMSIKRPRMHVCV